MSDLLRVVETLCNFRDIRDLITNSRKSGRAGCLVCKPRQAAGCEALRRNSTFRPPRCSAKTAISAQNEG